MSFKIYDYVADNGVNDIAKWTKSLTKGQRAKLNVKLDMLKRHGPDLFPHLLTGTPTAGIQKLRIHGNVELRPMLCPGPISIKAEYTILIGAKEVQSKLVPKKADQIADKRKNEIMSDINRRIKHERVD